MKKIILTLLVLSLMIVGCESEDHNKHQAEMAEENHNESNMHDAHNQTEEHHAALALNAGQKWQMDIHTRESIATIQSLFDAENAPSSIADLNTFGSTLDTEFQALISGCTMSGESHDQLHIFLEKSLPLVTKLSENVDETELNATYHTLNAMLEEYNHYFE